MVPVPAAEAMFGMGIARVIMAGQKLGIFRLLARTEATHATLATDCGLSPDGTRHLLRCLCALGHLTESRGVFKLTMRARKWLDPSSPTYIGSFIEFNYDQWEWWSDLEHSLKGGTARDIHAHPPDDPYWRRYITAMYELARLTAPELARRIRLGEGARILDAAGGHGWFAAELCRRNQGASATVMDLPGSVRIGRELIQASGLSKSVRHVEGDVLTDDLGGPYDAALCSGIIHHLSEAENRRLFHRIGEVLRPGGTLAVLDMFERPQDRKSDSSAFLGLHFFLTSAARVYREAELKDWLAGAGFNAPRRARMRSIPLETLYQADKR